MNILKMKVEVKDDIKAGALGVLFVILIVWSLTGCATNPRYEEYDGAAYKYYVIDQNSDEPDAYFETKDEAEDYTEYFKEHHTYKIVQLQ